MSRSRVESFNVESSSKRNNPLKKPLLQDQANPDYSSIVIENPDQSPPPSTNYLRYFPDPKVRSDLKKQILESSIGSDEKEMTDETLERHLAAAVDKHPWYFSFERVNNIMCIAEDILYTPFQIFTGKDGTKSTVNFFSPTTEVSDAVAYGASIALAIPDFAFNMTAIGPYKEALRSTFNRRYYKIDEITTGENKPLISRAGDFTKSLFHRGILLTHNITGAAANGLALYEAAGPIPALMNYLPKPAQYTIMSVICYFGNRYYSKYSNPDYYEGLNFWFESKKGFLSDGIINDLRKLEIARAYQVFLQAHISTVAMRAFPGFYYIAAALQEYLGGWASPLAVALAVGFHGEMTRAPVTYNNYYGAEAKLDQLLEKKGTVSPESEKQRLKSEIHGQHGYLGIFKQEPTKAKALGTTSVILLSGAAGGFYGYSVLAPYLINYIANEPLTLSLSITACAALPLLLSYRAERNRILNNEALKRIEGDSTAEMKQPSSTQVSAGADVFAGAIVIGSNLGRATSTIGSATRLNVNNAVSGLTTLIALQNAVNGFFFNFNKVKDTVSSWSMFKPAEQPSMIEDVSNANPSSSWKCWKRKK